MQHQEQIEIETPGPGFIEVTEQIRAVVRASLVQTGVCHIFCMHTSCSLVLQENADPSAKFDMEQWLARLAPENDPKYTHTLEGPDDMPSHLRSLVTRTSETIPVAEGALLLGTWQGIYLCEHRKLPHVRKLAIHVTGDS